MYTYKPYLIPLVSTIIPVAPQAFTIFSVTRQIPRNSRFFWTHTVQSINSAALTGLVQVQIIDSVTGPVTTVPVSIELFGGPAGRPFPLPEPFIFQQGAIITATIKILTGDPLPTFGGVILGGIRETRA